MDVSIPSILLGLGWKAAMGLALLLYHQSHLNHSFLGVFSLSLTLVDTLLTLVLSALYFQENMSLLSLHITRHHICLLTQIADFTYNFLLWPVVVMTGLDHYWTTNTQDPGPILTSPCSKVKFPPSDDLRPPASSIPTSITSLENTELTLQPRATLTKITRRPPAWVSRIAYAAAVCLLWIVALAYVFLGSGLTPVFGNQPPYQLNHCWVFTSAHTSQVAGAMLLTLACAMVYVHSHKESLMRIYQGHKTLARMRTLSWSYTDRQGRVEVAHQVLWIFLKTWATFLVLLAVFLFCQVEIPGYLGLNVPWLCLLNSFLLGVVLCVRCSSPKLAQGSVTSDGFCNWRLSPL
ncbi:hypothetical protein DPEC_G00059060 [Dallia pectoralis]|uniref:Uncharacterized protein n=1 Tax=Dallia pectoralis TaxID=75939 RepID=A0ACC2H6C2_DALPE|nr:hypothetical protein DPEC_G00059060 [Dallia pectoralis]